MPNAKRRPGPKPLSLEQLKEVWAELSVLPPRSKEFRRKRLELAAKFERTEWSLRKIFGAMQKRFAETGSALDLAPKEDH